MLPLLERPDELARLQADPAMLTTAVDEFVRWGSPIVHLARTVTAPTVIRDVELPRRRPRRRLPSLCQSG